MSDILKRKQRVIPSAISSYLPLTENIDFRAIRQGKATNELARMQTVIDSPAQINLYGDAVIKDKDFKLYIEKYTELINGVRPTAKMLLDALIITHTESGKEDTLVKLPLSEYMDMRGLRDVKSARNQVKEDIQAIDKLSMEFRDKRKGRQGDFLNIKISGGTNGIVRGVIIFRFNQDFFDILTKYNIMPYPAELLKLNSKYNPSSQYFLRKVSEHKNMNYYNEHTSGDIIGVKTLLSSTPEIPKYEELGDSKQVNQRIIEPFERDMDAIESFKWSYCGKKGTEVEPYTNYHEFINLNVKIEWINYPERNKPKRASRKKQEGSN